MFRQANVDMPVGPYSTFGACVAAQRDKGKSAQSARRICGWLEQQVRKADFADTVPKEPSWVAIHEAGDRLVPTMSRWIETALETFASGISERAIRAAVEGQHTVLTERLVTLAENLERPLDLIETAMIEGGQIGAAQVPTRVVRTDAVQKLREFAFDIERPSALAWAQQHAGELVRDLQDGVMDTIREITVRGLRDGRQVRDIAKDLRAMGPTLGLDRGSAVAVDNLRKRMTTAGQSASAVERRVAQYASQLLQRRAMTIARTEVLMALNEGQRESWRQAKRDGRITSVSKRTWIITPDERLCPRCEPQEDNTASIDGTYTLKAPAAGISNGPPLHSRCRCAEGLIA